jgi:hypothetical protein
MKKMNKTLKKIEKTFIILGAVFFGFALLVHSAERKNSSKSSASKTKENPTQGELPEVLIKGGQKAGVASEKPQLDIPMNADESLQPVLDIEQDILKRQPEALRNPSAGFSSVFYNKNLILPSRIRLARDPLKVFYPLRDILSLSPAQYEEVGTGWELIVTDSEGHAFAKFSGKGLPPANVPWNGRNDKGDSVEPGKNYSSVINYTDIRNQPRTYVGDSFSFDGVVHQEPEGLMISLNVPAIFENQTGSDQEIIKESGIDLLKETADLIKRFYFNFPIQVECGAKTITVAKNRAQTLSKTLGSLLLMPRGEIPIKPVVSDYSEEWVDIIITNR